jgi:hypothetical protein
MQAMVFLVLINVVRGLEKQAQLPGPRSGGSFQKAGWVIVATWAVFMPAVLTAGREVVNRHQELQLREVQEDKFEIKMLQMDVKELKAQLAKTQNATR